MFKRCLVTSLRSPETLVQATIVPVFMMLLFGGVFANIVDIEGFSYINFIVPGIILQSLAQGSAATAINVNGDMSRGIIDRFRSMSIANNAVLVGHAMAAIARNILTTSVTIGAAFIIGFRPQGSFLEWLLAAVLLVLFIVAITWLAILFGLIAKNAENANGLMFPLYILPFVSSGFAPTDTMPAALRWFAAHQPMTPMIDAIRALTMGQPTGNALWLALGWGALIAVGSYALALVAYRRKNA